MTKKPYRDQGKTLTLGILAILATLIALIPSFLTIARDRPDVYFHFGEISILNPNSPDFMQVKNILKENSISDSRLIVEIVNTGDTSANVKIGIDIEGIIGDITTTPSAKDQPVWVVLPDNLERFIGKSVASVELKNLAPTKVLRLDIRYLSAETHEVPANVEVFFAGRDFDGKQASPVKDIKMAPKQTLFQVFQLPLTILGAGVFLTLIISTIIVLRRNAALASVMTIVRNIRSRNIEIKRGNLIKLMSTSINNAKEMVRISSYTIGPSKIATRETLKEWNEYFKILLKKKGELNIRMLCPDIRERQRIVSLEKRFDLGFDIKVTKFTIERGYLRYQICDHDEIILNIQDKDEESSKAGVRLSDRHLINEMTYEFDKIYEHGDTGNYKDFIHDYVTELIPPYESEGVEIEALQETSGISYERLQNIIEELCDLKRVVKLRRNGHERYYLSK